MMNLVRKIFKIAFFAAAVLTLGGWWAVENALPYIPIKPLRSDPERQKWRLPAGASPQDYALRAEYFGVKTPDGVELQAFLLRPLPIDTAEKIVHKQLTLIMLHGIGGCKEHFLPAAKKLAEAGIEVVGLDLRAHGKSGGEFCTFGFYEKYDVSALVDTLLRRDSTRTIGILGNSLGGAIALQALAQDKRLKFGIIESTFHDLEKVVEQYGKNYSGIRSQWLARHTLERAGSIAHFDPFSVKPCEAARQIEQPVLMVHGDRDQRIPLEFGRINFQNLASGEKEWVTVHGAGHHGLWNTGGAGYFEKIVQFIIKRSYKI